MAKKKVSSKQRIQEFLKDYLFPTASVVVLILVLSLVTIPTIAKIQNSSATIKSKNKEVDDLEDLLKELKDLSETESKIVADNLVLDQYLPRESRVSALIDDINFLADSAGLEATELVGQEKVKKEEGLVTDEDEIVEKPKRVLITFNYVGTFDEVYKLFEKINAFKGLLSVESVSFSKKRQNWDVEITVASYNLPDAVLSQIIDRIINQEGTRRINSVNEKVLDLVKLRI